MSTYLQLRDRALGQVGCLGQAKAETVAETALEEAMKFVSVKIRIRSLIASATATAPASPELEANAIALTGGAGTFGISAGAFQAPDRLYVKKDSSATGKGLPYNYYEYNHFLDLGAVSSYLRAGVWESATFDERSRYAWTLTPDNEVWALPIVEDNVLTLFYRKSPAVYADGTTPEIDPLFDYILVNGAVLALKEWLREPEEISTLWTLFEQGLLKDVHEYDQHLNSSRRRSHLKIHKSYRTY